MPDQPLVSVIMLVYNSARYLPESIESVLNQSYRNLELLIVKEMPSTDDTDAIVERYCQRDGRINVLVSPSPGMPQARNYGWQQAQGKYVAWADSDVVYLHERLAAQTAFMDNHAEIGICGTWIEIFNETGSNIGKFPADDATIRASLLFYSPIANPSSMLRRDLFRDHKPYDLEQHYFEDFDLWVRAAEFCRFANLPQVLVRYRQHA